MPSGTLEITHRTLVLVEGPDEANFLPHLCKARGIPDVQFIPYDGKGNLVTRLKTVVRLPGFKSKVSGLGIIKDADADRQAAIKSVRDAFKVVGIGVRDTELTLHEGTPSTAFFISPGNGENGELEDCILKSIAGHPALPCVDNLLTCVEGSTGAEIVKKSKARIRAFLAVRPEAPLNFISEGAKTGLFPLDHAAFDGFATLIQMLD